MTKKGREGIRSKYHPSILADLKRLKLPEPDHLYGFSSHLLRKSLSEEEFSKFGDWMDGQTCVLDDKLGCINYTTDVIRGLDYIRNGTPTYWD